MAASLENRIDACEQTRLWLSNAITNILAEYTNLTEKPFATIFSTTLKSNADLSQEGWYTPPPVNIAALFSSLDNFDRLRFDTLLKEQY